MCVYWDASHVTELLIDFLCFFCFLSVCFFLPSSRLQLHATLAVPSRLLLLLLWLLRRFFRDLLQSDTQPSQPRSLIAPVTFKLSGCCQQLALTLRPFEVLRFCILMIRIQLASTTAADSSPFVFCCFSPPLLPLLPPPPPPLCSWSCS